MSVSVYYYFEDWNYRINLIHFAEELRAKIENNIKNCQSTNFGKSEYGVNVECSVILEPSDDCYDVYSETDKKIYNLYKETIKNADRGFITKLEANQPQTDSGARWWVRYVIVPLISGGSGAALIGWMLLR
jgi:hypothetical protein